MPSRRGQGSKRRACRCWPDRRAHPWFYFVFQCLISTALQIARGTSPCLPSGNIIGDPSIMNIPCPASSPGARLWRCGRVRRCLGFLTWPLMIVLAQNNRSGRQVADSQRRVRDAWAILRAWNCPSSSAADLPLPKGAACYEARRSIPSVSSNQRRMRRLVADALGQAADRLPGALSGRPGIDGRLSPIRTRG